MQQQYELVVIGAGPGGYVAAIKAAQKGLAVALVERGDVGGTCLNRGCVPTKAMLHAAELLREMQECGRFGLTCEKPSVDIEKLHVYKSNTVSTLRSGIEQLVAANKITLIRGSASIVSPNEVVVSGEEQQRLHTDRILIATGSVPSRPPIEGMELDGVMTSDELLCGEPVLPKRLLIVGGGVIGVEFASVFSALGSEVTIIEALPRVLANADREISQNLTMILKKRGVSIVTDAMVERFCAAEDGVLCRYTRKGEAEELSAERVLVAIGRRANTEGLFADGFSVEMERKAIVVNERFETSVPGIWAIGDAVAGNIQLAHVASAQGENAVAAMLGEPMPVNLAAVPSCVYTDPEIAWVGMNADQAKERGIETTSGKFLMSANAKTLLSAQERGFIKVLFDAETSELIGAQMMCARATDMIGELACAVANRLTKEQLLSVLHPHPTFCEGIGEAVADAYGEAVHILPKKKR